AQDPVERGDFGGEKTVELVAALGPAVVDGGEGKGGFGLEKVVEASLLHASPLANVIDRGAPVAPRPDQLRHGFEESFLRVADSSHGRTLVQLDERSTIFPSMFRKVAL